jgi:hypothetical protein
MRMLETSSEPQSWSLIRLGEFKDAAVALAGLIYILGYLAWSYYAWRYHLGPVPALQGQYFVAGFAVAAIFGAAASIGIFITRAADVWWPAVLESRSSSMRRLLFAATVVILFAAIVGSWTSPFATFAAMAVFPFVVSGFHLTRTSVKLIRAILFAYVALIAFVAVLRVVERWYPSWPQELGGGKPRKAYLTLRKSDAIGGSLASLRNRFSVASPEAEVYDTVPVYVLVRTSDSLVVALQAPNTEFNGEPSRFEVPATAIAAILWIEDR